MKPSPELTPAFAWDCPGCDYENFSHGVVVEITAEDAREMARGGDRPPSDFRTGDWIGTPDEVTCTNCGETFPVNETE